MEDVERLFDKTVAEIERMLNTKTVVGEPISIEGNTLIPLVSLGFGFGVGAGQGTEPAKGRGQGGGTGGGGGVKPVAVIVIGADGVRVEPVQANGAPSSLERLAGGVGRAIGTDGGKKAGP